MHAHGRFLSISSREKDAKATLVSRKEISKVKRNFRVSAVSSVVQRVRKERTLTRPPTKAGANACYFTTTCLLCLAAYFVFPRGIFIFISFFSLVTGRRGNGGKWHFVQRSVHNMLDISLFSLTHNKRRRIAKIAWIFPIISFVSSFMQFFSHAKEKEGVISLWPSRSVRRYDAREELRHFYASKCTPPFPLFSMDGCDKSNVERYGSTKLLCAWNAAKDNIFVGLPKYLKQKMFSQK